MSRIINNCPLVAILRNGNVYLFNHDVVIINNVFYTELSTKSIIEISEELYMKGIDIVSLFVDESRMKYKEVEVI